MDFNAFLKARRGRWERLTELLDRVDKVQLRGLSPQEAEELFALHRLTASDLNLVQTRTSNPAMLDYLERLVGRSHANLAVPRESTVWQAWWRIVRHHFPAELRRQWRMLAAATLVFLAGAALGFILTWLRPSSAEVFLGPEHLAQTPSERVAAAEQAEREGTRSVNSAGTHAVFSSFLFTNNIKVTIFCFVLGASLGIGTVAVLFFNAAMLGSIMALYLSDGQIEFFVAWVGPHGSVELPCILFGATAGLMVARAQLQRHRGSFRSQVRAMRPALVDLIVGTATLLVFAGLVEGGFSQINEPTLPYPFKIAVACALFAGLLAYLFWMPVKKREELSADYAD